MKITKLLSENIKRLRAVEITPDGLVITLAGNNGAGKSSVLDSIAYALGGRDEIPDKPIREGETGARVVCTLENGLVVTRKFTPGGTMLTITDGEGQPQRSPQAILDALVGNLAFDPLVFAHAKDKEQLELLRKLVGLDFSGLDKQREKLYNDRLLVGREVEILKGKLAGVQEVAGAPEQPVDVSAVLASKAKAEVVNRQNEVERNVLHELAMRGASLEKEYDGLKLEMAAIQAKIGLIESEHDRVNEQHALQTIKIAGLINVATDGYDKQIIEADRTNQVVRQNADIRQQKSALTEKEIHYLKFSDGIAGIDDQKIRAISAAKFPLPGLSFNDEVVLFNGLPLNQCSSGEKLRISVAVGMAINPKLRVIFIRNGSLLDAAGLKAVADMATSNDYQLWIEDARSSDPSAVVIEDGSVVK